MKKMTSGFLGILFLAIMSLVFLVKSNERGNKPIIPVSSEANKAEVAPIAEQKSNDNTTKEDIKNNTQADKQVKNMNTIVTLKTNKGEISLEFFTDKMPITTGNFIKLAKEGFYNGVKFHRVIKGFMIQGGDPNSKSENSATYGMGGPGYAIQDEFVTGLVNARGTISMANAGPNTGGSQFFINLADNNFLDGKHPVFGKVIKGMEVVDAIGVTKTNANNLPVESVIINEVSVE